MAYKYVKRPLCFVTSLIFAIYTTNTKTKFDKKKGLVGLSIKKIKIYSVKLPGQQKKSEENDFSLHQFFPAIRMQK